MILSYLWKQYKYHIHKQIQKWKIYYIVISHCYTMNILLCIYYCIYLVHIYIHLITSLQSSFCTINWRLFCEKDYRNTGHWASLYFNRKILPNMRHAWGLITSNSFKTKFKIVFVFLPLLAFPYSSDWPEILHK